MVPSIEEARDGLPGPDLARLWWCFEQGTPAFAKVKRHDGWYVGVHMDGIPFIEVHARDGSWAIGRKHAEA